MTATVFGADARVADLNDQTWSIAADQITHAFQGRRPRRSSTGDYCPYCGWRADIFRGGLPSDLSGRLDRTRVSHEAALVDGDVSWVIQYMILLLGAPCLERREEGRFKTPIEAKADLGKQQNTPAHRAFSDG